MFALHVNVEAIDIALCGLRNNRGAQLTWNLRKHFILGVGYYFVPKVEPGEHV